jgi:TQXA domain-containing protein
MCARLHFWHWGLAMCNRRRVSRAHRVSVSVFVVTLVAGLVIGVAGPAHAQSDVTPLSWSSGGRVFGTLDNGTVEAEYRDNPGVPTGIFEVDTDGDDAPDALMYCIDIRTPLQWNQQHSEADWSEANVANLAMITWILQNYPPDVTLSKAGAERSNEIKAVQAAIWHFSDGFDLYTDTAEGNNQAVIDLYQQIVADAEAVEEPPPPIEITPADQTGVVGDGLVYDVTSTASNPIALEVTGGPDVTIHPASGGICDTDAAPIAQIVGSGQVCLYSESPVGPVTLTASTEATVLAGQVYILEDSQSLIIGAEADIVASDSAQGSWTVAPEDPEVLGETATREQQPQPAADAVQVQPAFTG